jgi:hypothetical protein
MDLKPPRQATYTHTSGSDDSERRDATCIAGNSADSSFMMVSMTENISTAASIARMLRRLPLILLACAVLLGFTGASP